MGRATASITCSNCTHKYSASKYEIRNIGLPWHVVWATYCPKCMELNVAHSEKREYFGDLYFETKYDKESFEIITVVKSKNLGKISDIIKQIQDDRIFEYYVQQYVKENPEVFGLENLVGPFPAGPDFKGIWNGEEVEIEVERTYTNYKKHNHHMNMSFRNVSILICLDHKKPTQKSKEGLPSNIWYIDQQHFLEWYANFIEKVANSKSINAIYAFIYEWFQSRLIEEEVGYEQVIYEFPFEENSGDLEIICGNMANEFLIPYLGEMINGDFNYNEIDAIKLIEFYLSQKDHILRRLNMDID